jgi:hypothetical protein
MKDTRVSMANLFLGRAQEAIDAADTARSDEACAALFKEAETWLFIASACLGGDTPRPEALARPAPRVGREPRSFQSRD